VSFQLSTNRRPLGELIAVSMDFLCPSQAMVKSLGRGHFCSRKTCFIDAETTRRFSRIINFKLESGKFSDAQNQHWWSEKSSRNMSGGPFSPIGDAWSDEEYGKAFQDTDWRLFHTNCWFEDSKPCKFIPEWILSMKNDMLQWKLRDK